MKKKQWARRPKRFKPKKSIFAKKFIFKAVLLLAVFVIYAYLFVFNPAVQVKEVIVKNNVESSAQDIQNIVKNYLKSIFFINKAEIKEAILKDIPVIKDVKIKRDIPDRLVLFIEERQAAALYSQDGRSFFFIDKDGFAYKQATSSYGNLFLILDKENVAKESLETIWQIKDGLDKLALPIKAIEVLSTDRLDVLTSQGWKIYFNPRENLNWQLEKLKLVLEKQIPAQNRQELEYIDLRFGDKAFYKYGD